MKKDSVKRKARLNWAGATSAGAITAEVYFRAKAALGEGPVWADGTLYWTDIKGKTVYAKPDASESARAYPVGLEVGAFVLREQGGMVLAAEQGFHGLELDPVQVVPWADAEQERADNQFNDGKCDPAGRFVAGTLNRNGVAGQAALYLLDHDRTARRIYGPVTCSNGLAWSESGTIFFYIDTRTGVVRSFRYDLERGQLSAERVVVEIAAASGKPDGMTIDREGNLWIALWGGWGVECWDPRRGKRLARIDVPAALVTSCVFGGSQYATLFITTARSKLGPAELREQPEAGSIFCATPGVAGRPAVKFKDLRC